MNILDQVLTVSEAAKIRNVSNRHMRRLCEAGSVVCRKSDDGVWLILKSSIPGKEVSQ